MTRALVRTPGSDPDADTDTATASDTGSDAPAAPPEMPAAMKRSNVRFALALPLFFMVMFPLCYITALHQPIPHNIPVAVVGGGAAAFIAAVGPRLAGSFQLTPVGTLDQARELILQQTVKAAYVPAPSGQTAQLLVAGADGRVMTQLVPTAFTPIAARMGNGLQTVDIAPLAPGDGNGIGLMFFMLIVCIVGFMTANILGNAAFFLPLRVRLLISAGIAVLTPIVLWAFMGAWLQILQGTVGEIVSVIAIAALTSLIVGVLTTAAVVFLSKWALFPCMLLFIFLNIPSSNSAYPAEIVPPFFGWISEWHLGAAMVDAIRSILYLDSQGLLHHLLIIAAWAGVAAAAMGAAVMYKRRSAAGSSSSGSSGSSGGPSSDDDEAGDGGTERAEQAHEAAAAAVGAGPRRVLRGRVHGNRGTALPGATVTLVDRTGAQTGRASTTDSGDFSLADVPGGAYTVVASARGHEPAARSTVLPDEAHPEGDDLGAIALVPHDEGDRTGDASRPREDDVTGSPSMTAGAHSG